MEQTLEDVINKSRTELDWDMFYHLSERVDNKFVSFEANNADTPKYTPTQRETFGMENEYGGISGTLKRASFIEIAKAFANTEAWADWALDINSVVLDVGSGSGKPIFMFGCLNIKAAIGVEIEQTVTTQSHDFKQRLMKEEGIVFQSPVDLIYSDVNFFRSLHPVTHLYSFVGHWSVVYYIAKAIVNSDSIKVVCIIEPNDRGINTFELITPEDNDYLRVTGQMHNNQYNGYVFACHEQRKKRIKQALEKFESTDPEVPPPPRQDKVRVNLVPQLVHCIRKANKREEIVFAEKKDRTSKRKSGLLHETEL